MCEVLLSKISMGNDLVAYRARIGAYNCMKRCNKKGEINATFGVSKWIILQILTLLLMIAGVESNPGPISQYQTSIERTEEQLNHLKDLILKMKDEQQINSDNFHQNQRTHPIEESDRRKELIVHPGPYGCKGGSPNEPNKENDERRETPSKKKEQSIVNSQQSPGKIHQTYQIQEKGVF